MPVSRLRPLPSAPPEWRRSGGYLLLAALVHGVLLAWPANQTDLNDAKPLPLSVAFAPQSSEPAPALPRPARRQPPPPASPPKPAPAKPPVIAMAAAATTATTVAAPPAPTLASPAPTTEPAPAQTANAAAAAGPAVVPARFNAAYLNNPEPKYPSLSRRLGEEGKVLLKVRVTAEGLPAAVDLEKSSNFERLDAAAREVVARWRFVPARRGDQPVEASVIVPIVFRLEG